MYRVFFEKSVIKFLEKHKSQNIFIQFRNALTILQENPFDGKLDIKKLKWYEWKFRLRIWDYRFIYEIDNEKIIIFFYNMVLPKYPK